MPSILHCGYGGADDDHQEMVNMPQFKMSSSYLQASEHNRNLIEIGCLGSCVQGIKIVLQSW